MTGRQRPKKETNMSPVNNTAVQPLINTSVEKLNKEQSDAQQAKVDRIVRSIKDQEGSLAAFKKTLAEKFDSLLKLAVNSLKPSGTASEASLRLAIAEITKLEYDAEKLQELIEQKREAFGEQINDSADYSAQNKLDDIISDEAEARAKAKALAEAKADLRKFELPAPVTLDLEG